MEDLAKLTQEEEEILELTAELWNKFLQLGVLGRERTNDLLGSIL